MLMTGTESPMDEPARPEIGIAHQSAGNACLGVVVNSQAGADYACLDETIFAALRHMGLPYHVIDLAVARLDPDTLAGLRGLLLAQANLGPALGAADADALETAVRSGLGLVCFDAGLAAYPASLRRTLGLTGEAHALTRTRVRIAHDRHFITGTRAAGETLFFTQPVALTRVEAPGFADPAHCLLASDDGWPALVARPVGQGCVVTWTLHPQVWTRACFGHAMGLDDLFWKGIVWAARKPFVMRAMPPLVTYLEDDGSSSYNHFRYLDVFNDHGYLPHVELHIDDVDKVLHDIQGQDSQVLKAKADAGLAEFGAHAFTYNHHIYFDHAAKAPYPDAVLAGNFRRVDEKFRRWGIRLSRFSNAHFGEVGLNALPYLRERGIEFSGALLPFGVAWFAEDPAAKDLQLAPYGRSGFVFDGMPGYPEFFGVNALIMPRQMTGVPMVASEFLWNNTIFWDESPENKLQAAADQALAQMRLGLDSLFFGELYTHEQRIAVLSMRELDEILTRIDHGLRKHTYIHRSYEYIAEYARCQVGSRLTNVSVDAGGQMTCDLAGRATMTTSLYLFTETDGTLQQRFVDVPPFEGSVRVTL
jgi:hypothetical protein